MKELINKRYEEAHTKSSDTKKYAVDHIIPINNNSVSGLHVPWNLQVITETENSRKLNKFDGTYDNESWRKEYEEYREGEQL